MTEVTQNTSLIGIVNIIFNLYTESDYSPHGMILWSCSAIHTQNLFSKRTEKGDHRQALASKGPHATEIQSRIIQCSAHKQLSHTLVKNMVQHLHLCGHN